MIRVGLKNWLHAVVTALYSLFALSVGVPKLFAMDMMVQTLMELGYGIPFTVFIGACWTLAGVAVWLVEWREIAVLSSLFIVAGGIGSHLATGDPFPFPLLIPAVLGLGVFLYDGLFEYLAEDLVDTDS